MSGFFHKKVYIIIPDADITLSMVNSCTAKKQIDLRKQDSEPANRLIEVSEPVPDIFLPFEWYDETEIKEKIAADGDWL